MKKLDVTYQLSYDEAFEAFKVLASRRSPAVRNAIIAILVVIAVVMLVLYGVNGIGIHYLFLAIISIVLLAYIIYHPVLSAKRGANGVARARGKYHVVLHDDGTMDLPREEGIKLHGDKYSRIIETDNVFAIRPDGEHTVCIPKRILNNKETEFVRSLM